jgi:uncharacterized phage-associated protein
MLHKASEIAKVILRMADPEYGDIISNLKLQKLLYYVQGFHLAMFNEPLFGEDIVAWNYGPVVAEVYHEYKVFASGAIPQPKVEDIKAYDTLKKEQFDLICEIYDAYGQYSALRLMNATHEELPWRSTEIKGVITHKLMRTYFLTQLIDDGDKQN